MNNLLVNISSIFDKIENIWTSNKTQKMIWILILLSFVIVGFVIEINKIFLENHFDLPNELFYSIIFVFNLILFYEMIDLIFAISKSFSIAISKQMEIYSLVLLRESFKLVSNVSDNILYYEKPEKFNFWELLQIFLNSELFVMILSILGAIIVFTTNLRFKDRYSKFSEIKESNDLTSFIIIKKLISLVHIFVVLVFLIWIFLDERPGVDKVNNLLSLFFLSLIYVDILHLLVSYYYSKDYNLVFRNSSYSANTLLIRYSINTTPILGIFVGISACILLVLTIINFNKRISLLNESSK